VLKHEEPSASWLHAASVPTARMDTMAIPTVSWRTTVHPRWQGLQSA
jgi:hypothetical protein